MSQDITFCGNQCDCTECPRHSDNIKDDGDWYSFAMLKDTEDCERKKYEIEERIKKLERRIGTLESRAITDNSNIELLREIEPAINGGVGIAQVIKGRIEKC